MRIPAAFLAAACVCGPAQAGGFLDLYYVPVTDFEIGGGASTSTSDGGRGYGVRGLSSEPGSPYYFVGEYHTLKYSGFDGADQDTEAVFTRLGLGAIGESGMYGTVEWVKQEVTFNPGSELSDSGYAVHLGMQSGGSGMAMFYADVAWLDVGDWGTGYEYSLGGVFPVTPTSGVFVDYRSLTQKDANDAEGTFSDLRAGMRFFF